MVIAFPPCSSVSKECFSTSGCEARNSPMPLRSAPVPPDRLRASSIDAKICLPFRDGLHVSCVQLFAGLAPHVLHFPPRRLFHLSAQLAFFYRFDHARNILIETFLHLRELRLQFFYAILLPLHPLGSQLLTLFFQRMPLFHHLFLHAVQLVATAVQISD